MEVLDDSGAGTVELCILRQLSAYKDVTLHYFPYSVCVPIEIPRQQELIRRLYSQVSMLRKRLEVGLGCLDENNSRYNMYYRSSRRLLNNHHAAARLG